MSLPPSAQPESLSSVVRDVLPAHHRFSGAIVDKAIAISGGKWQSRFDFDIATMLPADDGLAAAVRGRAAYRQTQYLPGHASEVEAQLVEAGFVTEQYFVGQAYPPPRPGVPVPLAVAFVVR